MNDSDMRSFHTKSHGLVIETSCQDLFICQLPTFFVHLFEVTYLRQPITLDEVKASIRKVTQALLHDVSQFMMDDFTKHLQECLSRSGAFSALCF
jgi:hypothetical protein